MDLTLAHYSFLPWVRQGLGNQIIETDTLGGNLPNNPALDRPEVLIDARVKASKGESTKKQTVSKVVKIQGPGDVLGINRKSVIRVHPKKGVTNFETNNLAYIEFYEEDLPWRFTPAKPSGNKLRPWLALIVLKADEFDKSTSGSTPTPFISIKNKSKLSNIFGNEKDTAALAHVHVLEDLGTGNPANDLKNVLAQNPDLALSRVICPRKLTHIENGDNEYHAFVIPAFETGRQAGMGEDTTQTPAQKASWRKSEFNGNNHPLSYPYYYNWSFKVGANGDFESLAQLLEARELPSNIGKREMELRDMGFGITPTENEDVISYVEGAMRHEAYETAPWPVNDSNLAGELRKILNISADLQDTAPISQNEGYFYSPYIDEDPIISPPTYGKWHSGTFKLHENKEDWVHDINMHPTHRAAAGLGTRVVQQHQEKFMEMAWEQIGQINEANQKIIENEMAKRVSNSLMKKKINRLNEIDLMSATGGTFGVLKFDDGATAKKSLVNSRIPTALRSGTFLKVANNFTPTSLMDKNGVDGATRILKPELISRLNADEKKADGKLNSAKISSAPFRKEPLSALPVLNAFDAINSVVQTPPKTFMQSLADAIKKKGPNFSDQAVINLLKDPNGEYKFDNEQVVRAQEILNAKDSSESSNEPGVNIVVKIESEAFTQRISETYDQSLYDGIKFEKSTQAGQDVLLFNHALVIENRENFQMNFSRMFLLEQPDPTIAVAKQFLRIEPIKLQVPDFRIGVLAKLNPILNYFRRLNAFFNAEHQNLSKPIMAYPRFPIPMYDYLREISEDFIIPNISEIEPNTITLMKPNKHFIESFLAGMNHEFSRELLWREFPTDMRGSYFRHFWEYDNDPSAEQGKLETVEDYTNRILNLQETKADIKELHKWKTGQNLLGRLGENHNYGDTLILLVKGELLRKYPNTLVYAQKAEFQTNKNKARKLTNYDTAGNVKWPIITGKLEPDVYFFGFELTEAQAKGNRSSNAGWFFVLRERPGQISFGLDDLDDDATSIPEPQNWDQVTWEHITGNMNTQPKFLKIDGVNIGVDHSNVDQPTDAFWSKNSADMAYILYQSPILFARHASTMLS